MGDHSTTAAIQGLLDRIRADDPEAKRLLIARAYDRLLVLSRKILRTFPAVSEATGAVLNESYSRLSTALEDVRPATVREFLGLAALQIRRVLLDMVRKPRTAALPAGEGSAAFDPEDSIPVADSTARTVDIIEAIAKLPPEEMEVVDHLFWMGLTQAESAKLLGVHEDTVKRRWASARIQLGRRLDAYHPGR